MLTFESKKSVILAPDPFHHKKSRLLQGVTLVLIVITAVTWTGYSPFEERVVTLRYLLFALSGFIAFVMPYLIFPDSKAPVIQLGNVHGKQLLHYLLAGLKNYFISVTLFLGAILFGDLSAPLENLPVKLAYFITASGLFGGLVLLALSRYLQSGRNSQYWKESEEGRELRRKFADYFKFPLDPGSIPSLINTVLITFTGMIAIVISAILYGWLGPGAEMGTGLLVFFIGGFSLYRLTEKIDPNFYQSNAFYREFFGSDLQGREDADFRKVEQLWWVPPKLKAHVWQFLIQLDRVVPAGRVVGAGHVLVWFIAYQKPDTQLIFFVWLLFALAHQFFAGLTLNRDLAPYWLLNWIGSPAIWFFTRFWMQIRWILPLLLSMNLQLFIFGTPGYSSQAIVITAYLVFSMMFSVVAAFKLKKEVRT